MSTTTRPELLDEKEAADWLGLHWTTLRHYRYRGTGPAYLPWSKGSVRYRPESLLAWLDERETKRTSA